MSELEKSIITFSANEQNLQKTGGIGCYASDTVSYIEAHFALGENWSGYDSIRAVWFNDYKTISTVLDSDGVCIVPHEVLVNRGKVMVNLVGSVLVSDELSDRLTTFPCEALKVSAKAKISGSETAAVTPSQFDQFVDIVIAEVEKVTGMTAEAVTLPPGSDATAEYTNGKLILGIPQGIQGDKGDTGETGNGIDHISFNSDYSLSIVFTNGETFRTPPIRGERGPQGPQGVPGDTGETGATPDIQIGSVETLPAGSPAEVTITGTPEDPELNFKIPKGDTGEVTLEDLSSLLPLDTASGDIISIPDGQPVIPVQSLKVQLDPIQDLHGYDKPWSGGAGRNLLNVGGRVNQTSAEVKYTSDDNYIILNGTKNGGGYATMGNLTLTLPAGTYYAKAFVISGTTTGTIDVYVNNGTADITGSLIGSSERTITLESETTLRFRFAVWNDGTVLTNYTVGIVVSKTSGIDKFYPYSNICPISGHTEVVTTVSPTTDAEDGTSYTTDLGRTVYGGTLDVVSGELVVDRAIEVFDGSETWTKDGDLSGYHRFFVDNNDIKKRTDYAGHIVSNTCEAVNNYAYFGGFSGEMAVTAYSITTNQFNYLYLISKSLSSVADVKAYLASNPLQVVYELATPQTYQLDTQTISLLKGNNNVWSDGEVELTYNADVGLYIDKKLGTSGTRTLSMTRTLAKSEDTDDTKSVQLAED